MKIQGTIALVTGANRGIGRAFVEQLLADGASKIYAGARNTTDLAPLVSLDPERVVPIKLDVTRPADVAAAVDAAGDVTLVVNNAGVFTSGSVLDSTEDSVRRDMEVNYFGTLAVSRAFAPVLEGNGGGALVNVLSVVSLASMPALGGYNASKAAAWSLTQSLRAELGKRGIAVVSVFPGPIDTDMAKDIPMEKTSPRVVAQEVLEGLEAGAEDIFPDPMAKQVQAGWSADPKALERQFGAM
jgi:NAD(P)-dependent dehydrogenase (short-subunit alcohol dehydrogenase family)